jgi:ATP-dependent protease ClpP protease subunit
MDETIKNNEITTDYDTDGAYSEGENARYVSEFAESIKEFGGMNLPESKSGIRVIPIIGEIEGHVIEMQKKVTKYEHIIPILTQIEEDDDVEGVLLMLNTLGGDVEAGLAIAELVRSISKPSVSLVLGGGHSIGVPLAVCTDYSFIVPTATMTLHPIRTTGLVIGVWQSFEYFKKMQERIISFIVACSDIERPRLMDLMLNTTEMVNDVGSILIGQQAVDIGLINEVGGLNVALKKLKELIEEKKQNS